MSDLGDLDPEVVEEFEKARLDLAPMIGQVLKSVGLFKNTQIRISTTSGLTRYFFEWLHIRENGRVDKDPDELKALAGKTIERIRITAEDIVFHFTDGVELSAYGWLEEDVVHREP